MSNIVTGCFVVLGGLWLLWCLGVSMGRLCALNEQLRYAQAGDRLRARVQRGEVG